MLKFQNKIKAKNKRVTLTLLKNQYERLKEKPNKPSPELWQVKSHHTRYKMEVMQEQFPGVLW